MQWASFINPPLKRECLSYSLDNSLFQTDNTLHLAGSIASAVQRSWLSDSPLLAETVCGSTAKALLQYESKRADFEYVALNASELLLPEKRAELQELKLRH